MMFRRASDEVTRTVDEVCLPELVTLARVVLANGLTGDAAVVAMVREFGMKSARAASRRRFEKAMELASHR